MLKRIAEPELMVDIAAQAYAVADFSQVNTLFTNDLAHWISKILGPSSARTPLQMIDLGTGPGDIAVRIAQTYPWAKVVACDGSSDMIELARDLIEVSELADRVIPYVADALNLQLPSHGFDVVLSNSLLHHVREPNVLWKTMGRLVKKSGFLFQRDLRRPASVEQAKEMVHKYAANETPILQQEFLNSLLAAYTKAEVEQQLHQSGLKGAKVVEQGDRHLDVIWSPSEEITRAL